MIGWLIYSAEDVEKNKYYIQMHMDKFAVYNVAIDLIIVEEIKNLYEFIKANRPDFAINRSRNAEVAEELESEGIRVFNSSVVTKIANNKGKTYELLEGVVPFLPVKYGDKIITSGISGDDFSYPYVIKSCSGHGGSQVFMAENEQEEKSAIETIGNDEYVVQQCCSNLGKDIRVFIIGNKIIKALLRTSENSFKSNYSLGGHVEEYTLNDQEQDMVNAILKKMSLDYAGVDFIFHNDRAVFNEIEDAVGARMLYQVSDIDIVQKYVDYIMEELEKDSAI